MKIYACVFALAVAVLSALAVVHIIHAGTLTQRSDRLGTSAPATGASHHITFTTTNPIPASGKIVVTPNAGDFTIPAGFDFQDIDLLRNSTQYPVAAVPGTGGGSAAGVSVVSGTSGSITLTLNDTDAIAASAVVEIKIGSNAVFGGTGDTNITNPGSIGSYGLRFATQTSGGAEIDSGDVGIAIVNPIGVNGTVGAATVVDTPVFSPPAGTFNDSVSVSISTTTGGASIYYTVDGSTPTSSSILYTGPITLNQTTTLKAIGIAAGYTDSAVATAVYTIVSTAPPVPVGGGPATTPRATTTPAASPTTTYSPDACGDKTPADLNCDGRVNNRDLSILMYHWQSTRSGIRADINKDGIVNLIDFSIMLYWWTD
jgi:hypothetical protein